MAVHCEISSPTHACLPCPPPLPARSGQARLVMRQRGNLRLLLNANLWAEMQVSKMEGGKVRAWGCGCGCGCVVMGRAARRGRPTAQRRPLGRGTRLPSGISLQCLQSSICLPCC